MTGVDSVLTKGVKKAKRKKDNSKNNISTVHTKKMLRENILKIIVGRSFPDSNSNVKKQKQKTHDRHRSLYF